MKNPLDLAKVKLSELIVGQIVSGVILIVCAVAIVLWPSLLQILVAIALISLAYSLFYLAYKLHKIKKLL